MCILLKIVRYHNIFARLIFKCSPIEICTVWYIINGVCACECVDVNVFGWSSSLWMRSARSMHKQWTKSVQCRSSRQLRTTLFMPRTCRHRHSTKLSHIQIVVISTCTFTPCIRCGKPRIYSIWWMTFCFDLKCTTFALLHMYLYVIFIDFRIILK